MEEKKKKKITLTVSNKKPIDVSQFSGNKNKTSVVIEKKASRSRNEKKVYQRNENANKPASGFQNKSKQKFNTGFAPKNISITNNSEIRKRAEERTRRRRHD